jgi:hypothetical protein
MPIRTSANTYFRGIPKNIPSNFMLVAQTNNTVIAPMGLYLKTFQFYNRNLFNPKVTYPWNNI